MRKIGINILVGLVTLLHVNSGFAACGTERWNVKTGADPDAKLVDLSKTESTTIAKLILLPAQHVKPANARIKPYELSVYTLDAVLTLIRPEKDSDIHMVLADPFGKTLIAEIPSPSCVDPASPFAQLIKRARTKFEAKFPNNRGGSQVNVTVRVRGVPFFDKLHGQTGVAPNGIEIHPVLDIQFLPAAQAKSLQLQVPLNYTQQELNSAEDDDTDGD